MAHFPAAEATEALMKQVAALAASGASVPEIVKSLGITKYQANKILSLDKTRALIKGIGDEATATAKASIKGSIAQLASEITRVIKARLAEDDLEAVKVALRVVGFGDQEPVQADTNITVVLPGQKDEKTITIDGSPVGQSDVGEGL